MIKSAFFTSFGKGAAGKFKVQVDSICSNRSWSSNPVLLRAGLAHLWCSHGPFHSAALALMWPHSDILQPTTSAVKILLTLLQGSCSSSSNSLLQLPFKEEQKAFLWDLLQLSSLLQFWCACLLHCWGRAGWMVGLCFQWGRDEQRRLKERGKAQTRSPDVSFQRQVCTLGSQGRQARIGRKGEGQKDQYSSHPKLITLQFLYACLIPPWEPGDPFWPLLFHLSNALFFAFSPWHSCNLDSFFHLQLRSPLQFVHILFEILKLY